MYLKGFDILGCGVKSLREDLAGELAPQGGEGLVGVAEEGADVREQGGRRRVVAALVHALCIRVHRIDALGGDGQLLSHMGMVEAALGLELFDFLLVSDEVEDGLRRLAQRRHRRRRLVAARGQLLWHVELQLLVRLDCLIHHAGLHEDAELGLGELFLGVHILRLQEVDERDQHVSCE